MKQKFRDIVLFLLIFNLPFQLGKHFWLAESFIKSFRIDYLSPTLYLTDIIILLYLLLNLKKIRFTYLHLAILVLVAVNIVVSQFSPITLLAWLRLLIYFLLFSVLKKENHLRQKITLPFILSLLIVIFLEFAQLLVQHSLGGPFYLLGERSLSVLTPNVAKLFTFLRPYSTFSHPNSLAGYLLVSLLILPLLTKSKKLIAITILAIILTFSKAAWLTLILVWLFQISFLPSLVLATAIGLAPFLTTIIQLPSWLLISFSSRLSLLLNSVSLISDHWFLGVGLRQFIPTIATNLAPSQISYFSLQPVHNLFLLVISELGLLPVLAIITIILYLCHPERSRRIYTNPNFKILISIILLTGSLDHYWWTLPQNQLIILLIIALLSSTTLPSPKVGEGGTPTKASGAGEVLKPKAKK